MEECEALEEAASFGRTNALRSVTAWEQALEALPMRCPMSEPETFAPGYVKGHPSKFISPTLQTGRR
jgi:hypothetical protein